ncbi:hypothetical protein [Naumannella cuiyingiana]|uniref:Uncharacterized protein n=1 Tax=Naumannella cuiyingiana TaxID=1347891 RepID=A0A7Z0DA40_9ACTN|nr:hypothetical protein [Naumannella cuiyingiana]NYI71535.1 hypothetical protein [Naumannella cuiyingiana]
MPTAPVVHAWLLAGAAGAVAIIILVVLVRLLIGAFRTPTESDE